MTNIETFQAMFAAWGKKDMGKVVSFLDQKNFTFNGLCSDVTPLNKLFKKFPDGIDGGRQWNEASTLYRKPFNMELVHLSESSDKVYTHFLMDVLYFDSVRCEMEFVNVFTFKNGKVTHIQTIGDITPLEKLFKEQARQKATAVSMFEDLAKKFQEQDVHGVIALLHPECEWKMPKTDKAPFNTFYRDFPQGGQGFLEWFAAFGANTKDITCLEPVRYTAVNTSQTISEWKFVGYQFGAYREYISTWKHTLVDGKFTVVQCLDNLDEIMAVTTPEQNMATFKNSFLAWAQEDIEGCMKGFHENVQITTPVSTVEPVNKLYKKYPQGHEGMLAWIATLAETTEIQDTKMKDLSADKDTVFATFVSNGTFQGKKVPEYETQWVCKFKDGKVISIRVLRDISIIENLFA